MNRGRMCLERLPDSPVPSAMAQADFSALVLIGISEYIPAVATDFIFSAFPKNSLLGSCAVVAVYFLLFTEALRFHCRLGSYLRLIALAITTMFALDI